jgi:hypothetical protein
MNHIGKEKVMSRVKIRFDIDKAGARLLVLALVVMVFSGSVAWANDDPAAFSSITAAPLQQSGAGRHYYLSLTANVDGDEALTSCANGYHMASLWEILDPSNLVYNTSLGYNADDGGDGPSTSAWGWVRTGANNYTLDSVGQSNCGTWTSDSGSHYGTRINLPLTWTSATDIGPWQVDTDDCASDIRVWCVED